MRIAAMLVALHLGLHDMPPDVTDTNVRYRYQYLSGGVNTGRGWATWNPDGSFVSMYIDETRKAGKIPVFSHYQLLQSSPAAGSDERSKDIANLRNADTMRAYWADFELALERMKGDELVVFHVEPDLWGYLQQAGELDLARQFARRVVALRNRIAPNVALGYHMSTWGTNVDPVLSDPPRRQIDLLARRAAAFYRNLGKRFDLGFTDPSDRDYGFKERVLGDQGAGRWTTRDYSANVHWLRVFHQRTKLPLVMWQVPLGNTGLDDTWERYRDNHVQFLFQRGWMRRYRDAGVIAVMFGGGASGTTSETTDGGLFKRLVSRYRPLRLAR